MKIRGLICQNGEIATVDATMFDYLNKWKWRVRNGYASRETRIGGKYGRPKTIFMHRIIAGTPEDMWTDHKNRNRLDNRRSNLRICTPAQNSANRKQRNRTGFKGVYRMSPKKWYTQIKVGGKTRHLGCFSTPKQASRAYSAAAKRIWGAFASK